MPLWFATHAAGFGPLVAALAARDLPRSRPRADGDNAVVVEAEAEPRQLLAYCRGLLLLHAELPGGLDRAARELAKGARAGFVRRGGGTFALRAFGPDDPAPLAPDARRGLEGLLARATGGRPDSRRPEREFRLLERGDGRVLFLERITRRAPADEEAPRPGELPRTTCRLLAELSLPRPDDVFLDPFCGYGGIVLERALAAPYRFAFAQDLEPAKVATVKEALGGKAFEKRRKTIFPKARDALDEGAFEPGFVTAVATDPPWGLYEGGADASSAASLLERFLGSAPRLLAPGGRLVLLVSRDLAPALAAREPAGAGGLRLAERLDVLVSGKKASAIRLERN
jgi:hypothetical protein